MTGVYVGVIHGDQIDGTFTWKRLTGAPTTGSWHARIIGASSEDALKREQQASLAKLPGPLAAVPTTAELAARLPPVMHFCAANCMTLERRDDHYIRTTPLYGDGPGTESLWTVDHFTPELMVIARYERSNNPGQPEWRPVYRGRLSADGNRLVDITEDGFPMPTTRLTWGAALAETPGNNAERDQRKAASGGAQPEPKYGSRLADALVQGMHDAAANAPPPEVRLPPGASPSFASLRADIRALLQAESPLLPTKDKLPCDSPQVVSAEEALEIGRFAYRAAEYARGECWLKRSADAGSVRAHVVLGAVALTGLGMPKDAAAAVKHFDTGMREPLDPWAVYFMEDCYQYGWGTPVNLQRAAILNSWLMTRPGGQAVTLAIGADDAETQRQRQRMLLFLNPPTRSRQVCRTATAAQPASCHDEYDVDQQAVDEQLERIKNSTLRSCRPGEIAPGC